MCCREPEGRGIRANGQFLEEFVDQSPRRVDMGQTTPVGGHFWGNSPSTYQYSLLACKSWLRDEIRPMTESSARFRNSELRTQSEPALFLRQCQRESDCLPLRTRTSSIDARGVASSGSGIAETPRLTSPTRPTRNFEALLRSRLRLTVLSVTANQGRNISWIYPSSRNEVPPRFA